MEVVRRLIHCAVYNKRIFQLHHTLVWDGCMPLHCFGVLFNPKALWIGAHYGEHHKRWCINILPCLTVWWTKPGGYLP